MYAQVGKKVATFVLSGVALYALQKGGEKVSTLMQDGGAGADMEESEMDKGDASSPEWLSDPVWLDYGKVMVDSGNKSSLNPKKTVRKGALRMPSGEFKEIAMKLIENSKQAGQELAVLKELQHENVVKYIDFGKIKAVDGSKPLYIIMEFCERDLTKYMDEIKDEAMSVGTFTFISKQLLNGLQYIHEHGLIHRDIKPDNILLKRKTFKFSDFGITKRIPKDVVAVTQTRGGVGSDGYRAPESYTENVQITTGLDIFSLAIVFAQLMSKGKHPYGSEPYDWQYYIRHGLNLDLSNVCIANPDEKSKVIHLLTLMLSKRPEDRPSVATIQKDPFFRMATPSDNSGTL